jgi:hypothetical protein
MPFSHVRDQYQPEQIAQLTEAFERAWPQVALVNGASSRSGSWRPAARLRGRLDQSHDPKSPRPFLGEQSRGLLFPPTNLGTATNASANRRDRRRIS